MARFDEGTGCRVRGMVRQPRKWFDFRQHRSSSTAKETRCYRQSGLPCKDSLRPILARWSNAADVVTTTPDGTYDDCIDGHGAVARHFFSAMAGSLVSRIIL